MVEQICTWLATDTSGIMLTLFLCLAIGTAVGNVKIGVFSLGSTVGTLLMGVIVAILVGRYAEYQISPVLGTVFFCFFVFALGYDVGPTFVRSLKTNGLKLIVLALFFSALSFGVGVACYYIFSLGAGELAGMFAGSLTHSTVLGAAQTMMTSLGITGAAAQQMNSDMTAAYAVGYLISYAGCVILIKSVLPAMLGCKDTNALKAEVKKAVDKADHKGDGASGAVLRSVRQRAFRMEKGSVFAGVCVDALEREYHQRVQMETLLRTDASGNATVVPFTGDTLLQVGDVMALLGDLDALVTVAAHGLTEEGDLKYQQADLIKSCMVITQDMDSALLESMSVVNVLPVSAKRDGKQLRDLSQFKRGDVVTLMGTKTSVQKIVKQCGYPVDGSEASDLLYLSLGMLLGILIGVITFKIAGVPLSFGASGGILFLGIFCGWYSDKKPNIGHISPGARWLMKNIGLNLYVGCLGLTSGVSFLSSIQSMGFKMVIALVFMSFLPLFITAFFGKLVLRLDTVDVLGGLCGAATNTGALSGLEDETGSSIFSTACTPAYAMANISLTFIGSLCIAFFHS